MYVFVTLYLSMVTSMSELNNSTWTNLSTFLQNVVNDSNLAKNNVPQPDNDTCTLLLLCSLGVPGNLLVIAVYFVNMKTSTRAYMFALALADLAVCVCGISLSVAVITPETSVTLIYIINVSINFSVVLLVFMSIERLLAVRRPHSFSMNTRRAKKALIIIALAVALFTCITQVAFSMDRKLITDVLDTALVGSGTIIMIICYTLIAVGQLRKACASRKKIAPENVAPLPETGTSKAVMSDNVVIATSCNPGPSYISSVSTEDEQNNAGVKQDPLTVISKITAKQATNYKNVLLLFIVTCVFIACWVPELVTVFGVVISFEVKRLFVVNSVVNPFIYGVASAMFREDVRQFYRQTRVKLSACWHWRHTMVGSIHALRGRETSLPSNSR